jgi:hypothetical protein
VRPELQDVSYDFDDSGEIHKTQVLPAIQRLFGDDLPNVWFQQNGAGPHYTREMRNFLDRTFPM